MPDLPPQLTAALADRYALERELGQGGMSVVYLATDLRHRRKVAVKVLRPELAATLGPERFFREIEVAARLQHPHILPLHDSGEAAGFLYYVMPYVDGHNLRHRLNHLGELPIPDAVRITAEIADALAYAHGQGVVHRDIKPDNVLVSGRHALVTDFGVAKAVSEATGRQDLTTAGIALGTPAYMAPEQAAADANMDHRVDIYALGILGYELLTGRPPFTGTAPEILAGHMIQQPAPIVSRRPEVSETVDAIILKCLAKRAADRWQDAGELATQLEQQLTTTGGITPTQTRPMTSAAAGPLAVDGGAGDGGRGGGVAGDGGARGYCWAVGRSGRAPALGKRVAVTLDPGLELNPAVSPDGKLIAYSRMTPAETRLVVQQLAGGEPVTVAQWPGLVPAMPAWSADGARLAYTSPRGLEVIPALGGVTRLVASQTADGRLGWAAWSPAGDEIVYSSADTLYIRDLGADRPRFLLRADNPHSPAWSPDGKWIAFVSGNPQYPTFANLAPSSIWVAPAAGGAPVRITADRPLHTSPVWLPDSRSLLYVSDEEGGKDVYWVGLDRSGCARRQAGADHHRAGPARHQPLQRRPPAAVLGAQRDLEHLPRGAPTGTHGLAERRAAGDHRGAAHRVVQHLARREVAGVRLQPERQPGHLADAVGRRRAARGDRHRSRGRVPGELLTGRPMDLVPRDPERIGARPLHHARRGRTPAADPGTDGQQPLAPDLTGWAERDVHGVGRVRRVHRPGLAPSGGRLGLGQDHPHVHAAGQSDRHGGMVARRALAGLASGQRAAPR